MTTYRYHLRNGSGDVVGSADSLEDSIALAMIGPAVRSITLRGDSTPLISIPEDVR